MTADPPRATSGLTFHGPLSEARAVRLTGELAAGGPATVLDVGCGWGELMLRILAAAPDASGTGVDIDGDCTDLATLAERTVAAGFGPLRIQTATRGEWEEFESGYARGREEWLLARPGHRRAGEIRAELDKTRNIWLRGHRDVFGFAYLTLGVPSALRSAGWSPPGAPSAPALAPEVQP